MSAIVGGLILVALGVLFVITGLDTAGKLSEVIGAFAALIGLALSVYGVVLARRARAQPIAPGRQRVDRVDAGRGVDVVDTVAGSVRLGTPVPPPATGSVSPAPGAPGGPALGEQSVTNVQAKGAVRVIRGVGGDVDITP
jgi:drug/metabolite transporter (DMT)-like permease